MKTLFALLIAASGCAQTRPFVENPTSPSHPDAVAAVLPPRSTTLGTGVTPSHAAATQHHASTAQTFEGNLVLYTCPMHSEIIRTQPGECPKCHMTLVRKEAGK